LSCAKLTAVVARVELGIMFRVNRRPLAWLLAFPLMTAGSLLAHGLAYRLVAPQSGARADLLDRTGHGYLEAAPFILGACLAFVLAGLAAHASRGSRRAPARAPAWPLALLPLLGFACQEHLERLVATGELPFSAVTEPTFLVGLALQLPFALAALLAARLLGRAAEALGWALTGVTLPQPALRASPSRQPVVALLPNGPRLAAAHSGRAPPR
jgi:hypothetical protein